MRWQRLLMATALAAAFIVAIPATGFTQSAAAEDRPGSLPDFAGREANFDCSVDGHSFKVVGRQGMDRARWDETLSWMTEKRNMSAPDAETRKVLLDYPALAYPTKAPPQSSG